MFYIELTTFYEARELLQSQSTAWHKTADNLLVAHTASPLYARNCYEVAGTKIVYVTNLSARFESLNHSLE